MQRGVSVKSSSAFPERLGMISVPEELIKRCLKDDRRAQKELYELTVPYLYGVVRRQLFDPESWKDVLQEVYLKIFRGLSNFDSSKGGFLPWASRIAVNTAINHGTRNSPNPTVALEDTTVELSHKPIVIDSLSVEELLSEIRKMPLEFYRAFMLIEIEGFTHAECAEVSGISIELSRQRLKRSKIWLRTHLDAIEEAEHNIRIKLRG